MSQTRLVRVLRSVYFLYLTFLPMLATAGLGVLGLRPYKDIPGLVILGAALAGILYFGIMVELMPFPTTLGQALTTTFLTPLQLFLAILFTGENLWLFFIYDFVVEGIGMLAGTLYYAVVVKRTHGLKSVAVGFILLGIPVACLGYIYVPPIVGTVGTSSLAIVLLATAIVSSIITTIRRLKFGGRNSDTWCFIILGLLAWPLGGIFIPEILRNLRQVLD